MSKHIVWLIDENSEQLETYRAALEALMPESIEIRAIDPYSREEDNLPILSDPATACIIIDQRLKETGIASYEGIELAQYLRGVSKKLPIYILTNFAEVPDEFTGGEWSVEDIIDKRTLTEIDSEPAQMVAARILRRIDVYEDILGEREKRFNLLLRKSLTDELGERELEELLELQGERTSPIIAEELMQLQKLEQIVRRHNELLDSLEDLRQGEDEDESRD